MTGFQRSASEVLDDLDRLRAGDAPTHGGRVLSYVYDSGLAELDALAAEAARRVQHLNALDPTTYGSVAAMERDVVGFARGVLGGGDDVVGSVTSGGTESCLLAVKTARDLWRAAGGLGTPRLLVAHTVHAAFHKAAAYFDLALDVVPVDTRTGVPHAQELIARMAPDVALVVLSAPSYPYASLDPIELVAAAAGERGILCHVDACIGGFALAFWPTDDAPTPAWNLRVAGVTSLSADLHKYGFAPKGVSVLLHRGRDRHRAQYFALSDWPGYPVVNPTMLGSKPAGPLAAAWAIIQALGVVGFEELMAATARATRALGSCLAGLDGLRIVGDPVGPLMAVAADTDVTIERRVDPHVWADAVGRRGWRLQLQPSSRQVDGSRLGASTHLTVTPVTERHIDALCAAFRDAADEVRGRAGVDAGPVLAALESALPRGAGPGETPGGPDSQGASEMLRALGLGAGPDEAALPEDLAPVLALVEALPAPLVDRLLIELLARLVEPRDCAQQSDAAQ